MKKIKIKTKRSCKESVGEADLENRIVFVCNAKPSEKKHIIAHEKAHIRFNDILQSKPNKIKKYSEVVLDSPVLSDQLEIQQRKLKTPSSRGNFVDEYHAQTKEIQSRIKTGNKQLDSKQFKIAKKNLRLLQ